MKWTKLGRKFEPLQHVLPNGCSEFAQAPQALVLDDCIRVYFSTRTREPSGQFLSHIAFVEFDRKLMSILRVSADPVIKLGGLGCFDEHGIFPINVVRHQGKVYAFTCGWSRRTSVPVETSIGLAVSRDDGLTFDKLGEGPVLTSSLHQPCLVGDPFVAIYGEAWHMWYIYGVRWIGSSPMETSPARVYKIGHATSVDGLTWVREARQLISDALNPDECQALPTVIEINNRYHMYFCYRQATDFRSNKHRGYRIGYAWSDDFHNWTRDDGGVGIGFSEEGWDSEMLCYPHVFRCDGSIYMLYNGNEFGRFGFGLARLEA
jgi:hypothetical protein